MTNLKSQIRPEKKKRIKSRATKGDKKDGKEEMVVLQQLGQMLLRSQIAKKETTWWPGLSERNLWDYLL